ncbi:MAG: response regulator [Sphingopyxis sp.]|nr:response regulator [Sphingopyxis sp.]
MGERGAILLVEDDAMIALLVADQCEALGYAEPVHVDNIVAALDAVAAGGVAAALVDVHLGDDACWPVADALAAAAIPFALMTGGGSSVPHAHAGCPVLVKPFRIAQLDSMLKLLLAPNRA